MSGSAKTLFFTLLSLFCFSSARALELTLEENKAESGTIGYVDIEKVFRKYSVKTESKENFLKKVKEKEDLIKTRKEEINSIKTLILKLQQEKELAETLPALVSAVNKELESSKPAVSTQPAAEAPLITPPGGVVFSSSATLSISSPAAAGIAVSTIAAAGTTVSTIATAGIAVSTIATAGSAVSSAAVSSQPPSSDPQLQAAAGENAVSLINMPGVGSLPLSYFKFSVSTSPAEIDQAIKEKEVLVQKKEDELKEIRKKYDKELLTYEDDQTEKLLGDIYIKLREVSIKQGVSVVVDKKSILFGHKAVDLTDDLIKALEGEE